MSIEYRFIHFLEKIVEPGNEEDCDSFSGSLVIVDEENLLEVWFFVSNENKRVHEVRSWFGNRSFVVGQEERLEKELNHIRKMRGIFTPPLIKNVWIITLTHTNLAPVLNRDYQKR